MNHRAACYLRSSKDRKDVSIEDQRELLTKLASERNLDIVQEFVDVVESGKDEDRPGFQAMLAAIASPHRGWNHLLCRDTSRLARATWLCGIVDYEAHKRGIEVVYANVPDTDLMTRIMLVQIYRAQDQVHSIMSRDKGLAGMRQNVERGFRAGGRPPWGYQLKAIPQGIVRDGKEITKTVLEPADEAPAVQRYLQLRAGGTSRGECIAQLGLKKSDTSLVGVEWNALTYAGCTVWNVHREFGSGGYQGQGKRRPRSEWVIKNDTHPALITRSEAERILGCLENSEVGRRVSEAKRSLSRHLLTGLLQTPEGQAWEVNGQYYRLRARQNRHVRAEQIEGAVTNSILEHLRSDKLVDLLFEQSRNQADIALAPKKQLQARIGSANSMISKAMTAALMLEDPAPAMRKIDELERDRKQMVAEMAELEEELKLQKAAAQISREQIRRMLDEFAASATADDRKMLLKLLIEKVTLDPVSLECKLHYRIRAGRWESMASPRGFEPRYLP